jgi:hypothetical protein
MTDLINVGTVANDGTGDSLRAAMTKLNTALAVENMTALRALAAGAAIVARLRGYASDGDGGEGFFWWDSASSAADDGGTVICSNSAPATGRWRRNTEGKSTSANWFGAAAAASAATNTTAINNALAAIAAAGGGELVLPDAGTYNVTTAGTAYGPIPYCVKYAGTAGSLTIRGRGRDLSKLKGPATASAVILWLGESAGAQFRVHDLTIQGQLVTAAQGQTAISMGEATGAPGGAWDDVIIEQCNLDTVAYGVHGRGVKRWQIRDTLIKIRTNLGGAGNAEGINLFGASTDTAPLKSISIERVIFDDDASNGDHSIYVYADGGGSVRIADCRWLTCPANDPIKFNGGANAGAAYNLAKVEIVGNHIDGFEDYAVVFAAYGRIESFTFARNHFIGHASNGLTGLFMGWVAYHAVIEGNFFDELQRSAVYWEADVGTVGHVVVRDNRAENYNKAGSGGWYAFYMRYVDSFALENNRAFKGHASAAGFAGHQTATVIVAKGNVTDGACPLHFTNTSYYPVVQHDTGNSWNDPQGSDSLAGYEIVAGLIRPFGLSAQTVVAAGTIAFKGAVIQLTSSGAVTLFGDPFSVPAQGAIGHTIDIINAGSSNITIPHGGNFTSKTGADLVVAAGESLRVVRTYSGSTVIRQQTDKV